MARSDEKRLDDMREMCAAATKVVARGREAFDADDLLPLALERAFSVLGEAANHVSDGTRAGFPGIPWSEITKLRIRLTHHYHRIDRDLLWSIAVEEMPKLAEALGPLSESDTG